jgi:hypothetical protein
MAPTSTPIRLTPLAALIDSGLRLYKNRGLGETLAILRAPSRIWMNYDSIAAQLEPYAGNRTLNRVSIKTFAEDVFGIPNTRYVVSDGKTVAMPKAVGEDVVEAYLTALDPNRIDVDAVRAFIRTERDADDAHYRDVFDDGNDQ